MNITTEYIPNVYNTRLICSTSTYGIGLLTGFVHMICNILGCESKMYNEKISLATEQALYELEKTASSHHASGIMGVQIQLSHFTVFVSGMEYTTEVEKPGPNRYDKRSISTASVDSKSHWKCSKCQRINPIYTGTCSCGNSKYNN